MRGQSVKMWQQQKKKKKDQKLLGLGRAKDAALNYKEIIFDEQLKCKSLNWLIILQQRCSIEPFTLLLSQGRCFSNNSIDSIFNKKMSSCRASILQLHRQKITKHEETSSCPQRHDVSMSQANLRPSNNAGNITSACTVIQTHNSLLQNRLNCEVTKWEFTHFLGNRKLARL